MNGDSLNLNLMHPSFWAGIAVVLVIVLVHLYYQNQTSRYRKRLREDHDLFFSAYLQNTEPCQLCRGDGRIKKPLPDEGEQP